MSHLESQVKMRIALSDLEELFRWRKGKEALTLQESNFMMSWRAQNMRDLVLGFAGANIVSMLVTRRLHNLFRFSLAFGASVVCSMWSFGWSVESCTDRCLSLEGSRMQRELTNIMLKKYSDDPWILRRLSKHFYLEEVYEDSSVDKPKFRWHSRKSNFYGDPASQSQNASYDEMKTDSSKDNVKKTTVLSEDVYVNTAADASQNPFEFVFGHPGSEENIPSPKISSTSSGRRSRRRHRRHHQEDYDA